MKLIRTREISHESDCPWPPEYSGRFFRTGEGIVFCFLDGCSVVALSDSGVRKVLVPDCRAEHIDLPGHWDFVVVESGDWLMFSEHQGVKINTLENVSQVPEDAAEAFTRKQKPEKYLVESSFCFDDLTVLHLGQWGYECRRGNEQLWTFKGRAYLYTEIKRFGDHIYFCTAGNGGYFYLLNLFTGEAIASLKTGDTARMVQKGDLCYVLQQERSAKLVCVDLRDGRIVEMRSLPGIAARYSALALIGEQIHVVTFRYKKNQLHQALWNVVEL